MAKEKRYHWRIIMTAAIVGLLGAGGLWFWVFLSEVLPIAAPFEDRAHYHLRLLRYHGRESRDPAKQEEHAQDLIACGEEAIPVLV